MWGDVGRECAGVWGDVGWECAGVWGDVGWECAGVWGDVGWECAGVWGDVGWECAGVWGDMGRECAGVAAFLLEHMCSSPLPCTPPFPPLQDAKTVNEAVQYTSGVYEELAEMHSAQPKNDMIPALDVLKEYLGILGEFPDTQHLAKVSMGV